MFEEIRPYFDERGDANIGFDDDRVRDTAVKILKAHDGKGWSDDLFLSEILRRLKGHEDRNWIYTHSGAKVFLANPSPETISLDDIAHALSHLCRYCGQCNKFYCVGEHSTLVAQDVLRKTGDISLARAAQMHDSPEAYLCDVTAPLKDMLLVYNILEARFEAAITKRFGLEHRFDHAQIKRSDYEVFFTEKDHLFDHPYEAWGREGVKADVKIECWRPELAKERFLEMAEKLGIAA